ncbi:MAG: hypothetical protein JNJ89_04845 [Rubrivivax sp.]|nr:hypothetical protein [Rubrivivax sp.]
MHLPPEEATRLLLVGGWVLLRGVATLETVAPQQHVFQLAHAGDIVGWEPSPQARDGAVLRALTPCVLWQLPEPADEAARLRCSTLWLTQQAARAGEMADLRSGGASRRLRCLLARLYGPMNAARGTSGRAAAAASLPSVARLSTVVGLPLATVGRAMHRLLGSPVSPQPTSGARALRLPRTLTRAGNAVPTAWRATAGESPWATAR